MPCFLVAGSTGAVGSQVVRRLSDAGATIVALTRGNSGAANTEGNARPKNEVGGLPGVEILQASLSDLASLAAVFSRRAFDGALLLCANFEGQLESELSFIKACQDAKLPYIVKISTWSKYIDDKLDIRYAQWHGQIERELAASGLPYTSLRPCWFQQNLGRANNLPLLRDTGRYAHPTNSVPARMVDARDVGDVAASLLLLPAEKRRAHEGKHYTVSGPEAWSMADIAALVSKHRPAVSAETGLEEFNTASVARGDALDWHARSQLAGWRDCWMLGGFNRASSPEVLELCPPRRTVPEWIAEHMPEMLRAPMKKRPLDSEGDLV